MGSGARAYRAAAGEGRAIRQHIEAMIPITEQQAESEMMIRQKAFEQELRQAEAMGLLSQRFSGVTQPVFVPGTPDQAADQAGKPNIMLYAILGILAILFFKKGKLW
jgi:hypothetical protein